jgi:hypothetical protein
VQEIEPEERKGLKQAKPGIPTKRETGRRGAWVAVMALLNEL